MGEESLALEQLELGRVELSAAGGQLRVGRVELGCRVGQFGLVGVELCLCRKGIHDSVDLVEVGPLIEGVGQGGLLGVGEGSVARVHDDRAEAAGDLGNLGGCVVEHVLEGASGDGHLGCRGGSEGRGAATEGGEHDQPGSDDGLDVVGAPAADAVEEGSHGKSFS